MACGRLKPRQTLKWLGWHTRHKRSIGQIKFPFGLESTQSFKGICARDDKLLRNYTVLPPIQSHTSTVGQKSRAQPTLHNRRICVCRSDMYGRFRYQLTWIIEDMMIQERNIHLCCWWKYYPSRHCYVVQFQFCRATHHSEARVLLQLSAV